MSGTRTLDVGLVVQNAVPRDGQGRVMVELARALLERGHRVTVYAHRVDDDLAEHVTVRTIPRARGPQVVDDVAMLVRATRAIRRADHDVACVLGPSAVPKCPWVYNAQFSYRGWRASWTRATRPSLRHRLHAHVAAFLEQRCVPRADRLVASTPTLARDIDPSGAAPVSVVPNGIDFAEFGPVDAAERSAARRELGVEEASFAVAFLGDYQTPRKGLEPLLAAVASGPTDERLVVAARGDDAGLAQRARALGVDGRILNVGFAAPRAVYAACDVVAVPSLYEPFSLVTLEAAARGVPVVVSGRAGAAGFLDGGGYVVDDPENPAALRTALDHIRKDAENTARSVKVARAAVQRLTWPQVAGETAAVVEAVAPARSERVRVAYVADTMANMQMLAGLAERFDVTLVVPAALGDRATNFWPPPEGASIERVFIPGARIRFVPRVARWLAHHRGEFDVVLALDSLVGALGANLGRARGGPPVVLQVGRPTLEYIACQRSERSALRTWVRWLGARILIEINERRAGGIGTVSEYVGDECRRRNSNVRAIAWQGVDLDRFAPTCSKAEARERLGLPNDGAIVMWRSRLAPEKDPGTFLLAVDRLRREGRTVHAVYMGGEIDEMQACSRRLGVELIAGNAATAGDIPLWYVAADVNVQTSKAEGLGLSVSESLACETPVVVSDVGGLRETVDDARTCGSVVPPGDVEATAAAIARYLDDPEAARSAGAAGRRFVAERYERQAMFSAWAELIGGVADAERAA